MPIKHRITPAETPVEPQYQYSDPAGRYWPGLPGPGSTIPESEYTALPDYARETFTRVPSLISPPAQPADTAPEE